MQIFILFMDSVVGMWQQLSKNTRDDLQIGRHPIGKCYHALQRKGEFPNPVSGHPIKQVVDDKKRSYSRWWTVFEPPVFVEHRSEPHAFN
jgi:hypothetical protein